MIMKETSSIVGYGGNIQRDYDLHIPVGIPASVSRLDVCIFSNEIGCWGSLPDWVANTTHSRKPVEKPLFGMSHLGISRCICRGR